MSSEDSFSSIFKKYQRTICKAGTKLMVANGKMLNAVRVYQKGKKSMRTFTDSQNRFDNSMDALSVMSDHVPGFKPYARELVRRTNHVRKVQPGDENYVDLSHFGVERARTHAPASALKAEQSKNINNAMKAQEPMLQ